MFRKRMLVILVVMALIFNLLPVNLIGLASNAKVYVSMVSPAIPLTKGESLSLEDIDVEFTSKLTYKMSELNITDKSDGKVEIKEGKITSQETGLHPIEIEKDNIIKKVYLVVRESDKDDFVLFADDFSDGLSDEYRRVEGISSHVYIEDGFLFLKASAALATRLLFPAFLDDFGDYEIEVVATLLNPGDSARWNSVMFRNQEGNSVYGQMAIRSGASAANGVEIAERTPSGWSVPYKVGYKENIDPNKLYTYKVHAQGSDIDLYIDDELVLQGSFDSFYKGGVGLQANNSTMKVKSVKVTYLEGTRSQGTNNFVEIAQKDTGIIGGMAFSKKLENKEELLAVMGLEKKPANVIFYVNKDMEATDKNFQNPYMPIEEAIYQLGELIMPTIYIHDEDSATNLAKLLKAQKLEDVFVMAKDAEILKAFRKKGTIARGVLDLTGKYEDKEELSREELNEIRYLANANYASIVVLPSNIGTRDNVKYLYDRLMAVWIEEIKPLESKGQAYKLMQTGAHGIISDNVDIFYDVLDLLGDNLLLRIPLLIGHRGVPSLAPENTIEGALLAGEKGADVIETDIYLTKDGELIVMHDGNTARTCNGVNLDIASSTLAQLKELNANSGREGFDKCEIPTLRELYQAIKALDYEVQIFVEIKADRADIVEAFKKVTEEEGMDDMISSIMFSTNNLTRMKREYPTMSIGYLSGPAVSGSTGAAQTKGVLKQIQSFGSTYNPSYNYHSPAYFANANMRGITTWPWTINYEPLIEYFLAGGNGLTTDTCQVLGNFTKFLKTKENSYELKPGSSLTIDVTRETYEREEISANEDAKLIVLEGENLFTYEDGVFTFGDQEGRVIIAYEYNHQINDFDEYNVYSELVTIDIKTELSIQDKDGGEKNLRTLFIILGAVLSLVAIGLVIVLVLMKKKRETKI